MDFIATFYSHFGAMRFKKEVEKAGASAVLKPVPRTLSSSCGTCCAFTAAELPTPSHPDEVEQIVEVAGDGSYKIVFSTLE